MLVVFRRFGPGREAPNAELPSSRGSHGCSPPKKHWMSNHLSTTSTHFHFSTLLTSSVPESCARVREYSVSFVSSSGVWIALVIILVVNVISVGRCSRTCFSAQSPRVLKLGTLNTNLESSLFASSVRSWDDRHHENIRPSTSSLSLRPPCFLTLKRD